MSLAQALSTATHRCCDGGCCGGGGTPQAGTCVDMFTSETLYPADTLYPSEFIIAEGSIYAVQDENGNCITMESYGGPE